MKINKLKRKVKKMKGINDKFLKAQNQDACNSYNI